MPLFIASLNSGSNGNCYYVGNHTEAILVDVGISCREVEQRMDNLNLKLECVKGIFISHEHIDHIRGVSVLSKKYKIPVYISEKTLRHTGFRISHELLNHFLSDESIDLGELKIIPFTKMHDANDPFSFIVEGKGIRVGVITDIGIACKRVIHYFRQCHACFLESNYDDKMLEEGAYPLRLKNRIRGGWGHLSNAQALELFLNHRPFFMSHLILSHLSKNNNHPEIVNNLFSKNAGSTNIVVASRYTNSSIFEINSVDENRNLVRAYSEKKYVQLKLVI
jgi:phosphoribosyl 1,2-cyclic phosphodiesterase